MSEAVEDFQERIADWEHETGDRVDLHDGDADPVTMVIGPGTPSPDYNLLCQRLRGLGYEIDKEWSAGNEVSQAAFRIYFPDEVGDRHRREQIQEKLEDPDAA